MKPVVILEFPSNLGLKEPSPGHEPGVRKLPEWLHRFGFHQKIDAAKIIRLEPPAYSMQMDQPSGVRNADAIVSYALEQADLIKDVMADDLFPLVIGGDCSILIGNAAGLRSLGNYGLFFLDGHHDYMWPALSETGGAAGMDTAIVTGNGHEKLTNINGLKPYFKEEYVWCVGNREYDEEYIAAIRQSAIHYTDLDTLRKHGISHCINEFLQMVRSSALDGFWIHLDVDVLNDELMPAVDSRSPGGLSYEELDGCLGPLLAAPELSGIEITILDPELDEKGKYTKMFVDRFTKLFNASRMIR